MSQIRNKGFTSPALENAIMNLKVPFVERASMNLAQTRCPRELRTGSHGWHDFLARCVLLPQSLLKVYTKHEPLD
jgi:hypothetical protein